MQPKEEPLISRLKLKMGDIFKLNESIRRAGWYYPQDKYSMEWEETRGGLILPVVLVHSAWNNWHGVPEWTSYGLDFYHVINDKGEVRVKKRIMGEHIEQAIHENARDTIKESSIEDFALTLYAFTRAHYEGLDGGRTVYEDFKKCWGKTGIDVELRSGSFHLPESRADSDGQFILHL